MDNYILPVLSFVIPCYYSELTLRMVIEEIQETMGNDYDYEVILINDGSKDSTLQVIKKLCDSNNNIKGINFTRNFGQHSAIMAGYRYAKGDIIITVDDDGQIPVNETLKLIKPLIEEDYDIAIARYDQKKQSRFKNYGSKINDRMAEFLLHKPKELYFSSFTAAKKYIVDEMIRYENPYPYLGGLILRTTYNIINVDVNHRERTVGQSTYSFKKLLELWANGFTAFSVKPLRIGSIIGVVLAIIGVLYAFYIVIHKLITPEISLGWSSLMATQLIIGGAILSVLGLIGEYIGRIYICLNSSPQYVIKELINIESEQTQNVI